MALITCPECNREVSSMSKTCPNCGYPISEMNNDVIRIKIDNHPQVPGTIVNIYNADTNEQITFAPSGSVVEIKSSEDLRIYFTGLIRTPMAYATVSPKNGGKYRAVWGQGFFNPKITSCSKVDVIDS